MQTVRLQVLRRLLQRRVPRRQNTRHQNANTVPKRSRRHVLASSRFPSRENPSESEHGNGDHQIRRPYLVLRGPTTARMQLSVSHTQRVLAACTRRTRGRDRQ